MMHPALFIVGVIAISLAGCLMLATLAERRRRAIQARLASVLVAAPDRRNATDTQVSLRRTGTNLGSGGSPSVLRLYAFLLDELGATGDRLSISSLVVTAVIGAVLAGAM